MLQRTCAALLLVFLVLISVPVAQGQSPTETPSTALSLEQANGARPVFSAAESDFEPADKAASPQDGDQGLDEEEGHSITHLMMLLILQLGVIIIAAKIGGYLFQRFLNMPAVLGELASGMLIGPYALGGMVNFPGIGILFTEHAGLATSAELYGIATLASIILLFLAGLETDLAAFIRYSVVGSAVGFGGLIFSFVLGDLCAVLWPGNGIHSFMDPAALFLGVISVATSVGITARILAEKRKMASPEGVTILAGAVFDDVLGIIALAIVMGMAEVGKTGGDINWVNIGLIGLKAVGFFVVVTALGLIFARKITAAIKQFRSREIMVATCFGLALLLAGLAEMAGLAMIIGAYIMGLALSRTDIAHEIENHLQGVYNIMVPIFFCVMGMMVDFREMLPVLAFGTVYSLLAMVAKVVGCGLPAWLMRFNLHGSLRIGLGMLPRGEVALIVAGIGLSRGYINQGVFGVAIMMTVVTTMLAPPLLVKSFEGRSGLRKEMEDGGGDYETIELAFPSFDIADFLLQRYIHALQLEEFFVHNLQAERTYQVRKDDLAFTLIQEDNKLLLNAPANCQYVARMILLEELLSLSDLLESTKQMKGLEEMGSNLMSGLFA